MTEPDYRSMTDEQLLPYCKTSDEALELLIRRHFRTVTACARAYFLAGAEESDLIQEGMIGLLAAIRSYEPVSGAPFSAYAAVCVRRRLISAVRRANADKNAPLNLAVPLQVSRAELGTEVSSDPEAVYLGKERMSSLMDALQKQLSVFEREVLTLYLEGYSGREIALRLQRPARSADNAIQRIRAKAAALNSGR